MKENSLNIDGRTLYFNVKYDCSEYGEYWETEFFEEYEPRSRKQWIFFGPTITWQEPKVMFSVHHNINNPKLTKEYWRREIRKKLAKYDSLKNREEEINSNQYI